MADDELSTILDNLMDGKEDPIGVLYSLWVNITHLLADAGWTGEQLASDVHHHVASATTEGGMQ